MKARLPLAVLTALVAMVQTAELYLRSARQVTRTCDSKAETCVLLTSCPQLYGLLRPPTRETILKLDGLKCGFQGKKAMICCPSTHSPSSTTPSAAIQPPHPPTPSSNSSLSGEALLPSSCGQQMPLDKIFMGATAQFGQYPWMALLGYRGSGSSDPLSWMCGGSLINDRYILTAAHCTLPDMTEPMELTTIRLGEYNLDSEGADCWYCSENVLDFTPEEVVRHPDFNTGGILNDDIALIRLDKPLPSSAKNRPFIQPVCLPAPGETFSSIVGDKRLDGIGFEENEFGERSGTLRQVKLMVEPIENCKNYYRISGEGQACINNDERILCLHHPGTPVTLARNEWGGPPFVMVGIASFGLPCGTDTPDFYTDVAYYRDWIIGNLKP